MDDLLILLATFLLPDGGIGYSHRVADRTLNLVALISGGGRTVLNLQEHIARGALDARILSVVSSRPDAAGVSRAAQAGLKVTVVDRKALSDEEFQAGITEAVAGADLVCMAGFLSLWKIPPKLAGRVINIHPALLPDYGGKGMYGMRVHRAVLESGARETGCTVHFCDNEYDHGPVIMQRRVPICDSDTPDILAQRVFEEECRLYPEVIQLFAEGRIKLDGDRVEVLPAVDARGPSSQ